jgi:hypothetical protein
MRWACVEGHEWNAPASTIRGGHWCPTCAGKRIGIEQVRAVIAERGGTCISRKYVSSRAPLRLRCAEGHEWSTSWSSLQRGAACPACRSSRRASWTAPSSPRARPTLALLREIARTRGGSCLASEIDGARTKVPWKCSAGHEWSARIDAVKRGSWCPRCARNDGVRDRPAVATRTRLSP